MFNWSYRRDAFWMAPWLSTMIKWMWTTGSNTMIFWPTLFTGIRWDLLNNTNAKCLGQLLQIITLTNNSLFSTKKVYHYQLCIGPPLFYPQCAIFFCKGKKMESLPAFSFLTFYLAFLNKITSQSLGTNFFMKKWDEGLPLRAASSQEVESKDWISAQTTPKWWSPSRSLLYLCFDTDWMVPWSPSILFWKSADIKLDSFLQCLSILE